MSNTTESTHKAVILTITDINPKTGLQYAKSNGKQYRLCTVKFIGGVLNGKTQFANRTIGADKAPISVGDEVGCYVSYADNKPFFEISTSAVVDSAEDIMALLKPQSSVVPTSVAPIGEKSPF